MLAKVICSSFFISLKFPNSLILPPRQHLSLTVAVKANTLAKGSERLKLLAYKFPLSRDKSTDIQPELEARRGAACAKCISNAIQFPYSPRHVLACLLPPSKNSTSPGYFGYWLLALIQRKVLLLRLLRTASYLAVQPAVAAICHPVNLLVSRPGPHRLGKPHGNCRQQQLHSHLQLLCMQMLHVAVLVCAVTQLT